MESTTTNPTNTNPTNTNPTNTNPNPTMVIIKGIIEQNKLMTGKLTDTHKANLNFSNNANTRLRAISEAIVGLQNSSMELTECKNKHAELENKIAEANKKAADANAAAQAATQAAKAAQEAAEKAKAEAAEATAAEKAKAAQSAEAAQAAKAEAEAAQAKAEAEKAKAEAALSTLQKEQTDLNTELKNIEYVIASNIKLLEQMSLTAEQKTAITGLLGDIENKLNITTVGAENDSPTSGQQNRAAAQVGITKVSQDDGAGTRTNNDNAQKKRANDDLSVITKKSVNTVGFGSSANRFGGGKTNNKGKMTRKRSKGSKRSKKGKKSKKSKKGKKSKSKKGKKSKKVRK